MMRRRLTLSAKVEMNHGRFWMSRGFAMQKQCPKYPSERCVEPYESSSNQIQRANLASELSISRSKITLKRLSRWYPLFLKERRMNIEPPRFPSRARSRLGKHLSNRSQDEPNTCRICFPFQSRSCAHCDSIMKCHYHSATQ